MRSVHIDERDNKQQLTSFTYTNEKEPGALQLRLITTIVIFSKEVRRSKIGHKNTSCELTLQKYFHYSQFASIASSRRQST